MKRQQRIQQIISRFSEGEKEHVAEQVHEYYDARKQRAVESAISDTLRGYFQDEHISAVIADDDMQIRIDSLLRDVAYEVAAQEYAAEIDNQNVEGTENV